MPEFVKLGMLAEMPMAGQAKEFTVNGKVVCVANVDGMLAAINNVCIHRGGPLGQGTVERGKIVCPWHGWEFDPFTGTPVHNRRQKGTVYLLKIEGEEVLIDIEP